MYLHVIHSLPVRYRSISFLSFIPGMISSDRVLTQKGATDPLQPPYPPRPPARPPQVAPHPLRRHGAGNNPARGWGRCCCCCCCRCHPSCCPNWRLKPPGLRCPASRPPFQRPPWCPCPAWGRPGSAPAQEIAPERVATNVPTPPCGPAPAGSAPDAGGPSGRVGNKKRTQRTQKNHLKTH